MRDAPGEAFFEWLSPKCMLAAAEAKRRALGPMALRGPGKRFREAYVASRFAAFRGSEAVRLLPERDGMPTPDFEIKIGTQVQCYEITEADRPGRKRGDEDHLPTAQVTSVPDDEWTDPDDYQAIVTSRARCKAAKGYDSCQGLIIWSNASPIAEQEKLTLEWWRFACLPAEGAFAEVWVGMNCELRDVFERVF